MWRLLLLLGVLLLVSAGATYYIKENQRRERQVVFDEIDASSRRISGAARMLGADSDGPAATSSKASADQTLTWFLAGSGVVALVAGLAVKK